MVNRLIDNTKTINSPRGINDNASHCNVLAVGLAAVGGYYALAALKAGAITTAYAIAGGTGFLSGFITTGSLKGAFTGAFTSMAFLGIGQATMGLNSATKVLAHATAGGVVADLQGGKFGHGFISAGITKGAQVSGIVSDDLIQGVISSAIIGGTVSEITGGKFSNGAFTAAFQFAMNKFISSKVEVSVGIKKLLGAIQAEYSSDKGFAAKIVSELDTADGFTVELDSDGQIRILNGKGGQIGVSIDGDKYGLEGQLDVKVASFGISIKPQSDGIILVDWKVGISIGIFEGAYGETHQYNLNDFPLIKLFRDYYNPKTMGKNGTICTSAYGPFLKSACK